MLFEAEEVAHLRRVRNRRQQGDIADAEQRRGVLERLVGTVQRVLPALDDLQDAGEPRQHRHLGPAFDQDAGHRSTPLAAASHPKRHEFHAAFDNTLRHSRGSKRGGTPCAPVHRRQPDRRSRRAPEKDQGQALPRADDQRREAPARLRARSEPDRGGMVRGHQVHDRRRPEVRRQAPGIHPALRRARPVDDGGRAQPQDRARRHRSHGARAVLRARREGIRLRRRPARRAPR